MTQVLLVEDEPHTRSVEQKLLTRLGGYQVIATEDAEEFLRLAASGQIAAVVMDVSLTRTVYKDQYVDGVTLTRLLKADEATRHIPVLLATAHTLPGDAERLVAASGADAYVGKPFVDPEAFVAVVRDLIAAAAGQGWRLSANGEAGWFRWRRAPSCLNLRRRFRAAPLTGELAPPAASAETLAADAASGRSPAGSELER